MRLHPCRRLSIFTITCLFLPTTHHFRRASFYDFSEENNPKKSLQGNDSITLGAAIPSTGFKAMFKYVDGKTGINFKQGKIIAVGLLMDFPQEKKNKPAGN